MGAQSSPRIPFSIATYAGLTCAAFAWLHLDGARNAFIHPRPLLRLPLAWSTALALLAGLTTAWLGVTSTRWAVRRTKWAQTLHTEFRSLLGQPSGGAIALLAWGSAIAEELFFRGALEPRVGVVASAFLFACAHIKVGRGLWVWTAWAFTMGLVFGGLYHITGGLLAPIVAHGLINYENMHFIVRHDPHSADAVRLRKSETPRLVQDRFVRGAGTQAQTPSSTPTKLEGTRWMTFENR